MKQIVYVTNRIRVSGVGGREQLSRLNGQILYSLFGDGFERIELDGVPGLGKLFGYVDGVSRPSIDFVCHRIRASGARQVFLDGSNLGRLAEGIKKAIPGIEILTFFHNCEARFFLGALRRSRSPKALAVLWANYLAERSAVRFSDKRICLSQRDSLLLQRLYGRGATHIAPMAIEDKAPAVLSLPVSDGTSSMMLFVGGTFYANQVGIAWFVKNVVPRIEMPVCIVGQGFENYRDALEVPGKVRVVGAVDDLSEWYHSANFIIAPIFDGSGMKTKVAEALMYGKRVIGTSEAFSGYEDIADKVGWICNSSDEFVDAINQAGSRNLAACDHELRKLYQDHYSLLAARQRIERILN